MLLLVRCYKNQEAEMYPMCLDMKRKFQAADFADMDLRAVSRREAISASQLTKLYSCDSEYLTSLLVFRETKPCLELGAANMDPIHQKIQDKIVAALKLLTFREQHVLFWSPHAVGKHQLLTTRNQPHGIGEIDVGLCLYRRDSEIQSFVVDKDHEEEDRSPAARVFRRGLPEWTSDLESCTLKHFPQQESAICCNLRGYLALPVFDLITRLCVGVLELLTSSKYMSYAYEVQQFHTALKVSIFLPSYAVWDCGGDGGGATWAVEDQGHHPTPMVRNTHGDFHGHHGPLFLSSFTVLRMGVMWRIITTLHRVVMEGLIMWRMVMDWRPITTSIGPSVLHDYASLLTAHFHIIVILQTENLISPQGFDFPALYVHNESRQSNLDKIYGILKKACEIHSIPLSQTWAVSQHSIVFHEKVIEKSCSSFDTRCVGKVCMSTTNLPFNVQDLSMWPFFKACRERHLDVSRGFVGKALLSRGSCFCGDVTKLSEEEYPLVHNARMNRLASCFAIFLCSVESNDGYVLEFILPPDIDDSGQILNLVQTLKQNFAIGSGFELGDNSCIQVVGLPTDLSVNMEPDVIQISSDSVADNFTSSDAESSMPNPTNLSEEKTGVASTDAGEKSKKRKLESFPWMVTAEISFNDDMKFPISSGLSYLKNEVSQSFKLKGKKLSLKYIDEDDDLILIACDEDLLSA
ncbi:LOW QUALITY PROTEIN: hypothetical protein M8C21_033250, partial [Ambrosia artemisiifolia]